MTKQRTLAVKGGDLFKDLEAAAGDNKRLRDKFRRMRKEFGNKDFTSRFTPEQRAELLALESRVIGNWSEIRRLMGIGARKAREPKPIPAGEASHMGKAEIKRIKKALVYSGSQAEIDAIPFEKRAMCYMELGLKRPAAEALVLAAAQVERKDPMRGSRLREQAGDLFCECMTEENCGPLVAPTWSGTSAPGFHGALLEKEEPVAERTMYEEAIGEYRLAADLVRKTDPERAVRLGGKMDIAHSKLRDEEDGIRREE